MPSRSETLARPVTRAFANEAKGIARLEFEHVEAPELHETASPAAGAEAAVREKVAALEAKLQSHADGLPVKLEEARTLARLLARRDWEQELQQKLAEDRAMVRKACDDFERERTRYFAAVEAKMDPMLLSAAVRVALEKVERESEATLKVAESEAAMWTAEFAAAGDARVRVIGVEGMARGECVLETSVGTVELGIEDQLAEIERGFFDLMEKRPA
jgi:flagellar assembly protein FliH